MLLLVTWIVYGQPPNSYQAVFDSMEACQKARTAILQDASRMKETNDKHTAEVLKTPGIVGYNPGIPPQVSVTCAAAQ